MRKLKKSERSQRGCEYCEHIQSAWRCPHERCPYKEMDGYDSYTAFIDATTEEWIRLIQKARFYDDA